MNLHYLKQKAKALKGEIHALYLACRDPRTPWYARAVGFCVIGYALSPIDLIPDPIPLLGYLDDVILLPLGILLFRRLVPIDVISECRVRASQASEKRLPVNRLAAGIIIVLWLFSAALIGYWVLKGWL